MRHASSFPLAAAARQVRWLGLGHPALARWTWRRLQPSLVGRLVLAQLLLLVLLWAGFIGLLLFETLHGGSGLDNVERFRMVLAVADATAADAQQQQRSLAAIDRFQRNEEGMADEPQLRMSMLVWRGAHLVYASPGLGTPVRNQRLGVVETLDAGGQRWRARTEASARSDVQVTLVTPGDGPLILLTFNSRGFLLTPLLISLPFLALPAWLSVRLALRPWRRVSAQIAARGPHDLTPLPFRPRHRELRPLVKSVNALLRRVRRSAERERGFIADAAHELRTPLAAMRVNVEALQQQGTGSPRERQLLAGLVNSGDRAARLASQLVSLMRSDATAAGVGGTRTTPQALSLTELAQDRLAALAPLAASQEVELELQADAPVTVAGEREGLVSMLDNLIDNAIKYSPRGGTVRLTVGHAAGHALLAVADQGPGIAAQWHERVFDRFFRVPDQSASGSGLGLAIVRSVVERHRGQLTLGTPANGQGLLVTVKLPLPAASAVQG